MVSETKHPKVALELQVKYLKDAEKDWHHHLGRKADLSTLVEKSLTERANNRLNVILVARPMTSTLPVLRSASTGEIQATDPHHVKVVLQPTQP